jgi:hypothetical protein
VDAKPDAEVGWYIVGAYGNLEKKLFERIAELLGRKETLA